MSPFRYAPLALLFAGALVILDVRPAQAQSFVFRDDFGENEPGTRPLSDEWTVVLGGWFEESGFARNEGEATADIFSITFPRTGTVQYAIETRFSVPNTTFFFGSEVPSGLQGYRLAYGPPRFGAPPTLNLSRINNDRGVNLGGAIVAEAPTPLGGDLLGVRVLRDGETGTIEVYVDQGVGFGQKPLIRALDGTHPASATSATASRGSRRARARSTTSKRASSATRSSRPSRSRSPSSRTSKPPAGPTTGAASSAPTTTRSPPRTPTSASTPTAPTPSPASPSHSRTPSPSRPPTPTRPQAPRTSSPSPSPSPPPSTSATTRARRRCRRGWKVGRGRAISSASKTRTSSG